MLVEEQVFTPREFSILFDLHAAISCHQKFRVWYYFFTLLLRQWKLEESAVQVLIRPGNCNFKVVHFIFRACSFFYCASQSSLLLQWQCANCNSSFVRYSFDLLSFNSRAKHFDYFVVFLGLFLALRKTVCNHVW